MGTRTHRRIRPRQPLCRAALAASGSAGTDTTGRMASGRPSAGALPIAIAQDTMGRHAGALKDFWVYRKAVIPLSGGLASEVEGRVGKDGLRTAGSRWRAAI